MVYSAGYIGVLLAAGRGSRMGVTKQLLPWPPPISDTSRGDQPRASRAQPTSTVVSTSFDLIAPHCRSVIVALGHDAAAVADALAPREFTIVLSDPDAEMLHSIRLALIETQRRAPGQPVLLHPADSPAVRPSTVQSIVQQAATTHTVVMPEHGGRGGHPVAIPARRIHGIVTWQGEGGLRAYWQQHPELVTRLAVNDDAVGRDLDTPADYAQP